MMKNLVWIEYKYKNKAKDAKCSVRLVFKAKDACNAKNPEPRPLVTFKRCYDLKDGFTSVSNFYEIDEPEVCKLSDAINALKSNEIGRFKPLEAFPNKDYSQIVIKRKNSLKIQILKSSENFTKIKEMIVGLVQ